MRGRFEDHGDPQEKLKTMIETLVQGGWTMIFLGICSVLAVWVGIERGLNLRRRKVVKPEIVAVIENLRGPEDLGLALSICRRHPGPFSNIIRVVLENRTLPKEELHEAVENQGRQEVATLERGLVVLGVSVDDAPVAADSRGLLFAPYLVGERTPHADTAVRGLFAGLTPDHDRSHFVRAVLEGTAFALKDAHAIAGGSSVRITGGGMRNPAWRQIVADVLGVPVVTVSTSDEGAAYGSANSYTTATTGTRAVPHSRSRIDELSRADAGGGLWRLLRLCAGPLGCREGSSAGRFRSDRPAPGGDTD